MRASSSTRALSSAQAQAKAALKLHERTFSYGRQLSCLTSCTVLLILLALAIPWTVVRFIRQVSEFLAIEYRFSYWTIGIATEQSGDATGTAVVPWWPSSHVFPAGFEAPAAQLQTGLVVGVLISLTALLLACFACALAGRTARSLRGGRELFGADCACGWPAVDAQQKYARALCSVNAAVVLLVLTAMATAGAAAAVGINSGPFLDFVEAKIDSSMGALAPGVGIAAFAAVTAVAGAITGVVFLGMITVDDFVVVNEQPRSALGPRVPFEAGTVISVNQAHGIATARL